MKNSRDGGSSLIEGANGTVGLRVEQTQHGRRRHQQLPRQVHEPASHQQFTARKQRVVDLP